MPYRPLADPTRLRKLCSILVLAATLALATAAAPVTAAAPPAAPLSVSGVVFDASGARIEGAEATLHPTTSWWVSGALGLEGEVFPPPVDRVLTGADGGFRLEAPPGFWTVVVRADGSLPWVYVLAPLLASRELEPAQLPDAVATTVSVVDEAGRPVAGAVLAAQASAATEGTNRWRLAPRIALTDASGRATLARGPAEAMNLWGSAPGRVARWRVGPEAASPGEDPTRLVLPAVPVEALRVTAPDGGPARGAVVWSGASVPVAVADSQGVVEAPLWLEEGEESTPVLIDWNDAAIEAIEVQLRRASGPAEGSRVVRLYPASASAGRVVDTETGEAIAGAAVWFAGDETGVVTDSDGTFRLVSRGPWSETILATAPGYLWTESEPSGEDTVVTLDRSGTVIGRVVDEAARPLEGANVAALPLSPRRSSPADLPPGVVTGTTDADGTFRLRGVTAPGFLLMVQAEGHALIRREAAVADDGSEEHDLGEIVLEAEAPVTGRVIDPEGQSVEGARIVISEDTASPGPAGTGILPSGVAESASDGTFRVGGVAAGALTRLHVRKDGFAPASVAGGRVPSEKPIVVVLHRAASVAGSVVNQDGEPVAGAVVLPSWRNIMGGGSLFQPTQADAQGRFEVSDLKRGKTVLEARAPGYPTSAPVSLDLAAGERLDDVRLVLVEGATVTGRVLGPDDSPIAEARVAVEDETATRLFNDTLSATTRADGSFILDGVPPGRVVLVTTRTGWLNASNELDVTADGAAVEIRLDRGTEVRGRLTLPDGEPASRREVLLATSGDDLEEGPRDTTGPDGRFVLGGVAEGEHRLTIVEDGAPWTAPDPIRVDGAGTPIDVEIRLPAEISLAGELSGVQPAELLQVEIVARPAGHGSRGLRTGRILADGTYRIARVTPGTWEVIGVSPASGAQAKRRIEVEAGRSEVQLDLELAPGYTLTGTVTSDGEPVAGATVQGGGVGMGTSKSATTDQRGRFRLEGVPAGRQSLLLRAPESGALVFHGIEVSGDQDVEIALDLFSVRGTVLAADGSGPVSGATVRAERIASSSDGAFSMTPKSTTGADGSFLLTGIAPGAVRIVVEKRGFAPHGAEWEVRGDLEVPPVHLEAQVDR